MKKVTFVTLFAVMFISMIAASSWGGEEKASIEMGKKLFSDAALGGRENSKTCATCHAGGKGLEVAGRKDNLTDIINNCIVGALQGKVLDKGAKLDSLLLYIKSLEKK